MWGKLAQFIVYFVLAAALDAGLSARAQQTRSSGQPFDFSKDGIRFQINALVKPLPGSPHLKKDDEENRASLEVKLRISAHATGSRFFGVNMGAFSDFRMSEGSDEKVFLAETQCHQRRGLPKVTVTAIDGWVQTDKSRVDIAARPRQLGRILPTDEISAGARAPAGADKIGSFIAYSSTTSSSRLSVNVKIYTFECPLSPNLRQ